jgi:hypothetical protein
MAAKKSTKKAEPKKAAVKCAKHGEPNCEMHACTK